ncbi:hypothetical protein [Dysgonomonas sp. GY617]|uniref:hypothetical protein n=1 Tax=Dysgonomonas sp. GY617 TaxID=2780420 RepID=UPI00188481D4|nr:hypothetical protein [Dysgonomonas sp. GY617]MBF0578191.1 hypothetical protein [Dysgonomonas sp. GY617]
MINLNKLPVNLTKFMPLHQQAIVKDPESFKDFEPTINRLEIEIKEIPNSPQKTTGSNGSVYDHLIVYAHFFYAGCDWFILDWDRENDILYGYAILHSDIEMSELGTTYLSDITDHGRVELDFYWNKCSLAKALYERYPDYFAEPHIAVPVRTKKMTKKKYKLLKATQTQQPVRIKDWRKKIKLKFCKPNSIKHEQTTHQKHYRQRHRSN